MGTAAGRSLVTMMSQADSVAFLILETFDWLGFVTTCLKKCAGAILYSIENSCALYRSSIKDCSSCSWHFLSHGIATFVPRLQQHGATNSSLWSIWSSRFARRVSFEGSCFLKQSQRLFKKLNGRVKRIVCGRVHGP